MIGLKKCILTDCDPIHAEVVRRMSIIGMNFQSGMIVRSFEVGACKPDERMFKEAQKRLGVEVSHVLYIDDKVSNCVAFREMGGRALQYDCTKMPIRTLEEGLRNAGVLRM